MPSSSASNTRSWFFSHGQFLPLWGLIALLIVAASYQHVFDVDKQPTGYTLPDKATKADNPQLVEESKGKLLYCAALSLLIFTLIWNITLSCFVIRQQWVTGVRPVKGYWISFAVLGAVIILILKFVGTPLNLGGWYEDHLLGNVTKTESVDINGLVYVADTATACTILLVLSMLGFLVADRGEDDVTKLADRINTYKISIYSAGLSLGTGVFEIYALYSWSALYSGDKEIASALAFSSTMTVATGLLFSTLMIVMYLPVAFSLNQKLWAFYPRGSGNAGGEQNQQIQTWAASQGITAPPLSVFGSYVAILVPFATGILAKILQVQG